MFNVKTYNNTAAAAKYLDGAKFSLADTHENYEAILLRSADLLNAEIPENLLAVARAGAGYNNIPCERMAENGVVVFNTPGANANAVKELVLCGILLSGRGVLDGANWLKSQKDAGATALDKAAEKAKSNYVGREALGKTLGVVGLGAIGAAVAKSALFGLEMKILGYDPFLPEAVAKTLPKEIEITDDLERIYKECDYITLHLPLNDSTRGMVGEKQFAIMKNDAVLLNFARGGLADETALVSALENGVIGRYVTDFPSDGIIGVKNAIVFPHLGASTPEAEENCAEMAARQLEDYLLYGNIKNSVNLPSLSVPMTGKHRVCVIAKNCKKSCDFVTEAFPDAKLETKVRGDYFYAIIDLDNAPSDELVAALNNRGCTLKIRVIER